MWFCRNHGLECKSYMEHDLKLLNAEKVTPNEIREWYLKKFPLMGLANAKEYERAVNKVLEWKG